MEKRKTNHADVLIVGGGHAGAQTAIALRSGGFSGSITILSEEYDPPYERPPLSKDYFVGEKSFERLLLRPATFWSDKEIQLLLGERVLSIDPNGHQVSTDRGLTLGYGKLVWAAGGRPRTLTCPGAELAGVHSIRSRADVVRLRDELPKVRQVAIVGGGYIGLEIAAALRKLDRPVFVVEAQDRLLARVGGEEISRFFEDQHRSRGVEFYLEATVDYIDGGPSRVGEVRLSTGERVGADMVIAGIGITPAIEPLKDAGALGGNGVLVDDHCLTSLPDIFAIGDCALQSNRYANGGLVRLESVQNAVDQANVAAKRILGQPIPNQSPPWFWSVQYDLKIQTIGLFGGYDTAVTRGDPAELSFSIVYLKNRIVTAIDAVNNVKDFVHGRALVNSHVEVDVEPLRDTSRSLKDFAS